MDTPSGSAIAAVVRSPGALGTDRVTTRFVLFSQLCMVAGCMAIVWLEAGQTSVYLITVASFISAVLYALKGKSLLFRKLLLFGIVAGLLELFADHFLVNTAGALLYPEGYKLLSAPLYMPLLWAVVLTQQAYLSLLCVNRMGLLKATVLMGLLGSFYISFFQYTALTAGWWYFQSNAGLWGIPYYIMLFQALVMGSLPLLVNWLQRQELRKALTAGVMKGVWLGVAAVVAYYIFYFSWIQVISVGALCAAFPGLSPYINLCEYSLADIVLIVVGTLFWNAAYIIIIRDGFRNKFFEMPVPAAASNLAWEFVWGFMVITSLGSGFVWGLRGWFFLDIFIVYGILRYGNKQINIPEIKSWFVPLFLVSVVMWIPAFYLFIVDGYDTSMGATSAYMITVIMELLYILFYLSAGSNQQYYAPSVAWLRLIGNAFMSVFVFMHYPQMLLLQYMCLLVLVLDIIYLVLLHRKNLSWSILS